MLYELFWEGGLNTKNPQAVHCFIYLFNFIAVSVCFPVPRDRKRRKDTHACATARVPSIHKTCLVASAEQKRKTVPSSEISEESLADPSPYQTNGGRKKTKMLFENTFKVRQGQRKALIQ